MKRIQHGNGLLVAGLIAFCNPDLVASYTVLDSSASRRAADSRRALLKSIGAAASAAAVALSVPSAANSLDMDAFASQQLSTSSKGAASLSEDEALCKFGQPSPQRGDACVRAGMPTKPSKKGGVDAFGQVDR